MIFDVILIGNGRTENALAPAAPYDVRRVVEAAQLRLARALVAHVAA